MSPRKRLRFFQRVFLIISYFILILSIPTPAPANAHTVSQQQGHNSHPGRANLWSFVPNQGQFAQDIIFHSANSQPGIQFNKHGLAVRLAGDEKLQMHYLNANSGAYLRGIDPLPGHINYFLGRDPAFWQADVPTFGGITYESLYPGIVLQYAFKSDQALKGTYEIASGADPAAIEWRYDGAEQVYLEPETGDLHIRLHKVELIEQAPIAWQERGGQRVQVEVRFTLTQNQHIGFSVGSYDPEIPLIIDPEIVFSLTLGGSGLTEMGDIALDKDGNIYVTGTTQSVDFPLQNPVQGKSENASMVFVTKLDASGENILYSTYLGGPMTVSDPGDNRVISIAVDDTGSALVAGYTHSTQFPTRNAAQAQSGGDDDAFLAKLSPLGNELIFSTYLGGTGRDIAREVKLDRQGNIFLLLRSESADLRITGAFTPGGAPGVLLAQYTPAGGMTRLALVFRGFPAAGGLGVDQEGNAVIVGYTEEGNLPFKNSLQAFKGNRFGYVVKVNTNTNAIIFGTYLAEGGNVLDVALDKAGNIYLVGFVNAPGGDGIPIKNAYQPSAVGNIDAFLVKLAPKGELLYSTYLGGSDYDVANRVAIDAADNIYVAGSTSSPDFPTKNVLQRKAGEGSDVYVSVFDTTGQKLLFSTFLGGSATDGLSGLAIWKSDNLYLGGMTGSRDFPRKGRQLGQADVQHAYILRISLAETPKAAVEVQSALPPLPIGLEITQTPDTELVVPGEQVTLTLKITNQRQEALKALLVTSILPDWVEVVSATSSLPKVTIAQSMVVFSTDLLEPKQTATVRLTIRPTITAPEGTFTSRTCAEFEGGVRGCIEVSLRLFRVKIN